jgi:hypothetical protein
MESCAVLVSFEGPDWYAWRGGLAGRLASLSAELVAHDWVVHHVYLGDPRSPGTESLVKGRLTLHRWAQWLSAFYPGGVYEGEEAKAEELARSLPPYVMDLIQSSVPAGSAVTVLAEEWQTARFVAALAEQLQAMSGPKVDLIWRAGSQFGWERLDWDRLAAVATIAATTPDLCEAMSARGVTAVLLPADPRATIARLTQALPPPAVSVLRSTRRRSRDVPAV